ncbi:restriction endonuclease subunit S [Glycomyces buryatensis]|uniref:Type I restriction modification DNA specificity domain-containing protein n=1 Tax=Glycomyces buryatensis TaxID=2570927 RepID=A0A4S8QF30_9ACTN|nr:restriction endonuclease subunit S [Glycomyces buryatensis]THV43018.1 hypothetical protein FAB82_03425 [Glycomyces buryatensis]
MTWQNVPLRRVFRIVNGGTPKAEEEYWGGGIPWATPVDVGAADCSYLFSTERTLTEEGVLAGSQTVPNASLIVSTRAPIGYVAETTVRMAFNQGCRGLIATTPIDSRYFRYQLLSRREDLIARGAGSTFLELSTDALASLLLVNPPLDEQRRIADFLDVELTKNRALIIARNRQIDVLNQRQSAFERSAIAGGFSDAAIDSGTPWIGKINERAALVPLQRIAQLQRGVDLTEEERQPGKVPVVTTAGINGYHDKSIVRGPGVVVGRYGSAGSVHWIETDFWPHNTTLYVKQFNGNLPKYCYYVLRSIPYEMEQARAAVPGINRNDIHKRLMPLLPLDMQQDVASQIDSYTDHTNTVIAAIRRSIDLLVEQCHALITAAVTGKIDVTTARGFSPTGGVSA